MKDFEYFEPATLSEAIALLAKHKRKAKIIAGGTDLLVGMKQGVINPRYLVNIKNIPGLNHIHYDEKAGFRIGALTTLHTLETSQIVSTKIPVLGQAAHEVGAPRLRNVGTIGGVTYAKIRNACIMLPLIYGIESRVTEEVVMSAMLSRKLSAA